MNVTNHSLSVSGAVQGLAATACAARAVAPEGWTTGAPRAEISARFAIDGPAGRDGQGAFAIPMDARDNLVGRWTKTFPVAVAGRGPGRR